MQFKMNSVVPRVLQGMAAIGVAFCLSVATVPAEAATLIATPSSNASNPGDPTFTVDLAIQFGPSENPQAIQVKLDLVDGVEVAPTTFPVPGGVAIVSGNVGSPGQFPIASFNLNPFKPACTAISPPECTTLSPAEDANYFTAGTTFAAPGPGLLIPVGTLSFSPTAAGTMNLVIDTLQTFWQTSLIDPPTHDLSGTIATFTVGGAVPEAPLALLLGPALFLAAFLRRKQLES